MDRTVTVTLSISTLRDLEAALIVAHAEALATPGLELYRSSLSDHREMIEDLIEQAA